MKIGDDVTLLGAAETGATEKSKLSVPNDQPSQSSLDGSENIGVISTLCAVPASTKENDDQRQSQENPQEKDGDLGEQASSVSSSHAVTLDSVNVSEKATCRICREDDSLEALISPCLCTGSVGFMHMSCLEKWLGINGRTQCELCSYPFPVEKVSPTIWQYLRNAGTNMDVSSLVCDLASFFLLTPLLIASTYLCSAGVEHYVHIGKRESVFAMVTLMISLFAVYFAWAVLAFMYHRRVWLMWRERSYAIRLWNGKIANQKPPQYTSRDEPLASVRPPSFLMRAFFGLPSFRGVRHYNTVRSVIDDDAFPV